MDGNGTLFGTLCGNTREILHKFTVDLPKKHGRGGQSALRFARLRMEKRHNYVRKVAELATQIFITNDRPNVRGLPRPSRTARVCRSALGLLSGRGQRVKQPVRLCFHHRTHYRSRHPSRLIRWLAWSSAAAPTSKLSCPRATCSTRGCRRWCWAWWMCPTVSGFGCARGAKRDGGGRRPSCGSCSARAAPGGITNVPARPMAED
jgi:hypothetical protein